MKEGRGLSLISQRCRSLPRAESKSILVAPAPTHIPPWLLTEARLWEEPECLLGSMEEMPLRVSLLLLLGL